MLWGVSTLFVLARRSQEWTPSSAIDDDIAAALACARSNDAGNASVDPDILVGNGAGRDPRGPQKAPPKVSVRIRLDADLVEVLSASGDDRQARVNDALRLLLIGRL
jgi:uncharacterized protein (DUF4415 family)